MLSISKGFGVSGISCIVGKIVTSLYVTGTKVQK
jgi:hypothetical protein